MCIDPCWLAAMCSGRGVLQAQFLGIGICVEPLLLVCVVENAERRRQEVSRFTFDTRLLLVQDLPGAVHPELDL